ncbi:4Fe-4S dicluster domain-containing protein [Coralloluteibacterium stylophorae]|uniref:Fe-S-cluster-containing hydrogenase n=1 Tax=Coralloluteibacterium stylophorae TaxID=1776034 RepID=A0A8J7VSM3_9GAMM|nr:4Fe-4S dicluster domain-containing protein [Coralloluteibacterium stylophorae]MBS7456399.1 Fe-S-cluster-containing hydrogenase [Coralloluteibacterium stylophorae]
MPPLKPADASLPDARFERLRAALAGTRGAERWAALDQLVAAPGFEDWLRREHPRLAAAAALHRRDFLRLAGASLALAGVAGCGGPPAEEIVPWQRAPEARRDDDPRFYATALGMEGDALGVLVESHQGRPTKVEGNPDHPASLGATDTFAQAAVLEVWDPDRSRALLRDGNVADWNVLLAEFAQRAAGWDRVGGRGLHVLTPPVGSPTLAAELERLRTRWPQARHHAWEPWHRDQALAGAALAFGRPLEARPHLERARVVLALDADPLARAPGHVRLARGFADGRRVDSEAPRMSRLYVAEPTPSLTGANADHRLALAHDAIGPLLRAVAARLGIDAGGSAPEPARDAWAGAAAEDLAAAPGEALVLVGETQPPWVHALAALVNERLQAFGRTLDWIEPVRGGEPAADSLDALLAAMAGNEVDGLLVLGANPVYDAPADGDFARLFASVAFSLHLGLHVDETARLARWHVPQAHALESWGDALAADGTASIVQPLMAPLYDGRTAAALLAALQGEPDAADHARVRARWPLDDAAWHAALQRGVVRAAPAPLPPPALDESAWRATATRNPTPSPAAGRDGVDLVFRPDPTLWDGRHANNGWLQELPRPQTTLTWENAFWLPPELAAVHGLRNGDEVAIEVDGRTALGAAWIVPGQAPATVTAFLGGGRRHAGRIGDGVGTDAYAIRTRAGAFVARGARLRPTGRHRALAPTQLEQDMHGREPVRTETLAALVADAKAFDRGRHRDGPFPSLYPQRPRGGIAWGMSIDLNACIGCGACTLACQAENNIPVVGADEVRKGREMHWIRVDRYLPEAHHAAALDGAAALHQPVPCMHCEHAPCELVCPVGAAMHDADGLNVQVYNRCVGTRFCSNNCPYKVRRFNFLQYTDDAESLAGQRNPSVTVRGRGVMEKCTFCIQRIRVAEIDAHNAGRAIADGEVRTACEAVCPTRAIVFGNLADADSEVARSKRDPRHYDLLAELNTRPRTGYLGRLRNPNPRLERGDAEDGA